MRKENKPKLHRKDIEIKKGKIEVDCIVIEGKTINLTPVPHSDISNYATHDDCADCGTEFEKRYTYQRKCGSCLMRDKIEKYNSFTLVEWDGETPLAIYDDDIYFFSYEEIEEYCEENEVIMSDLMLVLCNKSTFRTLDYDYFMDDTHEDWEPSTEFETKVKDFNEWLEQQNTHTYFPTNKRVTIFQGSEDTNG